MIESIKDPARVNVEMTYAFNWSQGNIPRLLDDELALVGVACYLAVHLTS